jgi:hypothetical protein
MQIALSLLAVYVFFLGLREFGRQVTRVVLWVAHRGEQ